MIRSLRALSVALVLVLVSSSVSAAGLQYLGTGGTVADLIDQLRVSRAERAAKRGDVKSNVVSVDWTMNAFIIPVAGSLPGAFGTFFKSDVSIANRRNVPQIISVGFLYRSQNNGSQPVQNFTLPANFTDFETDFVGTVLRKSGLGTILVVAKTSTGAVDDLAEIDGFSRIWTPQPPLPGQSSSAGTVSQAFEAIDLEDNLAESWGYGLKQDSNFRTNIGLVNLYSTSNTFTVEVAGLNGRTTFTQTVLPYSMEQVGIPAGNWGDLFLYVESAASNFNWWSAYGTTVDNRTGDGWVSHIH